MCTTPRRYWRAGQAGCSGWTSRWLWCGPWPSGALPPYTVAGGPIRSAVLRVLTRDEEPCMNVDRVRPTSRWILSTAGLLLLVGGVSLGSLVGVSQAEVRPVAAQAAPSADFPTAVRHIAAGVRPAVVQITNEQVQVGQFNQPFTVPSGVGSGVLYDAQGHILTNAHVVAGARQLLVSLPDRRSFPGKLVGTDPQTEV